MPYGLERVRIQYKLQDKGVVMLGSSRSASRVGLIFCALSLAGCLQASHGDAEEPDIDGTAAPLSKSEEGKDAALERRKQAFIKHWDAINNAREVIAELETSSGNRFHCIPAREDIATPPPPPPEAAAEQFADTTQTELQLENLRCPEGSVPTIAFDPRAFLEYNEPPASGFSFVPDKGPPPLAATANANGNGQDEDPSPPPPAPDANDRYYVAWNHFLLNFGTRGIINHWTVPEHSGFNETSLEQTAVAAIDALGNYETVEVGFVAFPYGVAGNPKPDPLGKQVFFTYFTNSGHDGGPQEGARGYGWDCGAGGNDPGCGWVQWPGSTRVAGDLVVGSTPGSSNQKECYIEVQHYQNNWWVYACDQWIGYYPGSLFYPSAFFGGLANGAFYVLWYGEIRDAYAPDATPTDMGSGVHGGAYLNHQAGYGNVQYMRNMKWISAEGNPATYVWIDSPSNFSPMLVTDRSCYSGRGPAFDSGAWHNYFLMGGPGLGGKDPVNALPDCM